MLSNILMATRCSPPLLDSFILMSFLSPLFSLTHRPSSYLRVTLDDGEQRLMDGQECRLVDGRGQMVEGHQLERSEDQYDMVRVGDAPLPLAQQ